MRKSLTVITVLFVLLFMACAQVPKQSVELSATIGRDIAEVYRAHKELAMLLYERMKQDINEFVDDVYVPYQISKLLEADREDFETGDENTLFAALDDAVKHPDDSEAQKDALDFMDVFVQVVRDEVESYRAERLEPVLEQEKELLAAIDRSYLQIHYANSIVTGHLASIVKVHDAQESVLNEFGIKDLRKEVGEKLASRSNQVAKFVERAQKVEGTIEEMEAKIKELTDKLDKTIKGSQE